MIISPDYDVFIAFHDSSGSDGGLECARHVYDYLTSRGLKCFFFPEDGSSGVYKANFIKIMQSRLLVMVCNDRLQRTKSGEIDYKRHYHLYVELDTFYAMAQSDTTPKTVNDAAMIYYDNGLSPSIKSPETVHPLFNNRNSFFLASPDDDEDALEDLYDWACDRLEGHEEDGVSKELLAYFTSRGAQLLDSTIEGVDFRRVVRKASTIKCMGISNWTFSLNDGCRKLLRGLGRDTEFVLLYLDPDGEYVKLRADEEQKDTRGQIIASFDMMRSEITSGMKRHALSLDNLSMYLYDLVPRENLIFVYSELGEYLFIQHYARALPGSASPCIVLRRNRDGESPLFEYYERIFESTLDDPSTKPFRLI